VNEDGLIERCSIDGWRIGMLVAAIGGVPSVSVAMVYICGRCKRELKLVWAGNIVKSGYPPRFSLFASCDEIKAAVH
jgi:hypothetical protein